MKISYTKVIGQGHQRGQGHSKNKKYGKFAETCGELKISFLKFPYKFDILVDLVIFGYGERWCSVRSVGPGVNETY